MVAHRSLLVLIFLLLSTSLGAEPLRLVRHFPAVTFQQPVAMVPYGGEERWLVAEREGRLMLVEGSGAQAVVSEYADLRRWIESGPAEAGLLGVALHPDFANNGTLFLSYTRRGRPLVSVIARFKREADGRRLDLSSGETVLEVEQPYGNHNGGQLAFGLDSFLYIGFGDGGAAGDPQGNGQNLQTLLGKMVRIDVNGKKPYAIPADNPFSRGGGRGEIFAWGLRNPWRWSFDRVSGRLWAGDVGQSRWEEINIIEKGKNYGWNRREGRHCFRHARCESASLSDPVAEYGHEEGCSVTGGYVYRGQRLRSWQGVYLYGDYCSGKLWMLDAAEPHRPARQVMESGLRISSFAEGEDGELYLMDITKGTIYRVTE